MNNFTKVLSEIKNIYIELKCNEKYEGVLLNYLYYRPTEQIFKRTDN